MWEKKKGKVTSKIVLNRFPEAVTIKRCTEGIKCYQSYC